MPSSTDRAVIGCDTNPAFFSRKGIPIQSIGAWRALVPEKDWVEGRSAYLLAHSWFPAGGLPERVRSALQKDAAFAAPRLAKGIVEHRTRTQGKGGGSATDLLGTIVSGDRSYTVACEAKVDEGFDAPIARWLTLGRSANSAENRQRRLDAMCKSLALESNLIAAIRYQLIHRAFAAVTSAKASGHGGALLMVHSFLPDPDGEGAGWSDFVAFGDLLRGDTAILVPGRPWQAAPLNGLPLYLLWVPDQGGAARRQRV